MYYINSFIVDVTLKSWVYLNATPPPSPADKGVDLLGEEDSLT
jgi:hypothetical protein